MKAPVTGFPFSVMPHPMYFAATTSLVGYGLYKDSASVLLVSVLQAVCYWAVVKYHEGPYMKLIYSKHKSEKMS